MALKPCAKCGKRDDPANFTIGEVCLTCVDKLQDQLDEHEVLFDSSWPSKNHADLSNIARAFVKGKLLDVCSLMPLRKISQVQANQIIAEKAVPEKKEPRERKPKKHYRRKLRGDVFRPEAIDEDEVFLNLK